jgi:hypothetical protein
VLPQKQGLRSHLGSDSTAPIFHLLRQLLLSCFRTRLPGFLQSLPERTDSFTALELLFSLSPKAGLIAISFRHVSQRLHAGKIKHNLPLIALLARASDFVFVDQVLAINADSFNHLQFMP